MKLLLLFSSFVLAHSSVAANRPNVLFIAFDDMRPQLGCFGDPTVKSPNLDALAQRGMVFKRSYVQQALCSRSRISMLSGRYPATTGIFEIGWSLRTTMPDITTLPQHLAGPPRRGAGGARRAVTSSPTTPRRPGCRCPLPSLRGYESAETRAFRIMARDLGACYIAVYE